MTLEIQISSTSDAQRAADMYFSRYVRLRDMNADGFIRCITCGARMTYDESSCGHFIKRRYQSVRYDPLNGWAQCGMCNCVLDGNDKVFAEVLKTKFEKMWPGEDKYNNLLLKKQEIVKVSQAELTECARFYALVIEKMNRIKRRYHIETPIEFFLQSVDHSQ